jgi:NAD(P)H-quinone oxidoreductase subunit 5
MVLAIISFGLVALAQATFPLWATHPAATGLRVHLANGLYANAVFDRLIGNWYAPDARRDTAKPIPVPGANAS